MSGVLTNQQRSSEFYRIAYKCAETKATTGCGSNCATCVLNVHLYVDDVRDATLIKTTAAMDYGKWTTDVAQVKFQQTAWSLGRAVGWVLVILTLCFGWSYATKGCSRPQSPQPEYTSNNDLSGIEPISISAPPAYLSNGKINPEFARFIYETNLRINKHPQDLNRDGTIDCIDRALHFKQSVSNTRLMWIKHPTNGLNHLFVQLQGINIEVYNYSYEYEEFNHMTMEYAFSKRFDTRYVKDVTAYAYQIQNRTMDWVWERY